MTEQNFIDILFIFLRDVCGNFLYSFFISSLLTPKFNKLLTVLTLNAFLLILYYLVSELDSRINVISIFVAIIVISLTLYKEKKIVCLFAVGMFFIVVTFSDFIVSTTMLYIFGCYPAKMDIISWDAIISMVFSNFQMIINMYAAYLLWNKFFKKKNSKSMSMFILFPISQAFFMVAFAKGTYDNNALYTFDNPMLIVAIIISVFSDVVMYFALRDNSNMQNMKQRLKEIENEMSQQLKYYDAIAEKYTEIREYRHDILNLVSTAEIMLENKLSESESEAFIKSMKKKAADMEVPIYCSNPLINAVLWQKQQAAEKSGIKFLVDIEYGEDFPIDRIDICSLMVNLIDNALRESGNCAEPYTQINVRRRINMMFIEVNNSCTQNESKTTKKIPTTKDGDHGYGMEIINKIADKYKGEFVLTTNKGNAKAVVALNI